MTFRGSEFGGPRYGWGSVRGTAQAGGGRDPWNGDRVRGQFSASPEAGLHRGDWQWRGHGSEAASGYGWEYQSGVGRDARVMRTGAGMGPRGHHVGRLAGERSGGRPRGGGYGRDFGGPAGPRDPRDDPRWRGDSQRIREELRRFDSPSRGFGQATAWNRHWNEERGSGRDAGRGRDDGFRPRSYF